MVKLDVFILLTVINTFRYQDKTTLGQYYSNAPMPEKSKVKDTKFWTDSTFTSFDDIQEEAKYHPDDIQVKVNEYHIKCKSI